MKKKLYTFIISASLSLVGMAAPAPTILTIKETITDNAIVYPESFETDTQALLKNWYIQNYTVLDENVENLPSEDVSDAVYIKRLKSIPTIIEMPYNQVVKSYIKMYTQKKRTLVETMLGMSLYYLPIFEQALEKEGLPLELKYLPVIESALNPNAVSRVGATGLWQFMLGTAKGVGLEVNSLVDERRDPYRSSDKAAQYLKSLYSIYDDWSLAIAAYNCGPGNVNKALRRAGGESQKDFWSIYPYLPAETRGYVPAFIAANYVMTYFKQHNISPTLAKRPLITDTVHVTKRVNLQQISDVLHIPIEEVQVLNPHFRQNVIPGDIRPYALTLPSQQVYSYIMSEDSIVAHNATLYARRSVVEPATTASYNENSNEGDTEAYTKCVVKYHKVRSGDNITKVANKYGVSVSQLKKWNKLNSTRLMRGQSLRINTYVTAYRPSKKSKETESTEENNMNGSQEELAVNDSENNTEVNEVAEETPTKTRETASTTATNKKVQSSFSNSKAKEEKNETASSSRNKQNQKEIASNSSSKTKNSSVSSKSNKETSVSSKRQPTKTKVSYRTHTVRKGESLSTIADKYAGVSISDIRKANGISGNRIKAGDKLKIPRN